MKSALLSLLVLFRQSAMGEKNQDECLATSPYLATRLHVPHAIEVRLHVHKNYVFILTPETTGLVGV